MPVVSILMPSLNVVKYISECMESVIRQTLKDIEIICIDAGSTDGTFEKLVEYTEKDNRIRIIKSDRKSYGYQMNLGIDAAKGEYIGIVETDDYISEDMFEKLYKYVSENKADFVKSRYIEFVGTDNKRRFRYAGNKFIESNNNKMIDLSKNSDFRLIDINHIWSGLYQKDFLTENGIRFNETPGASFQDTSFSILVGCLSKTCIYTTDSFYYYRMDNANSSVKQTTKVRCVVDEFKYIESELKRRNIVDKNIESTIKKIKLGTYMWNYHRLTDEAKIEFMDIIKAEMSELQEENCELMSDPVIKKQIDVLTKKELISEVNETNNRIKNTMKKIADKCKKGSKFCIVGAGVYGKYMLDLQQIFDLNFIEVFADNSKELQGAFIDKYKILSIEDVLKQYRSIDWIIASKKYSLEIKKQLINLGISDESIFVMNATLEWPGLINYFD